MELNWELNALEETDVVSLVLLLVIRSVGDILVSYLCLQFWKNWSQNIMHYYCSEKILLIGIQITHSVDPGEWKTRRWIGRHGVGRRKEFAPFLSFLSLCSSPLNSARFNNESCFRVLPASVPSATIRPQRVVDRKAVFSALACNVSQGVVQSITFRLPWPIFLSQGRFWWRRQANCDSFLTTRYLQIYY